MNNDIGSLCSGAGMLDRALESLFGLDLAWHAETDRAASQVLDMRWPGVPNLGDITQVAGPRRQAGHLIEPDESYFERRADAWRTYVAAIRLMAAGFPCTPFSAAGPRGGSSDERHLWPTGVLPAITGLLPDVLVLENVPNLLAIESGTVFGKVIADLDELGYSVSWTTVGACKVGACHHRHRLFALAVRSSQVAVPSGEPICERRGAGWAPIQDVLFGDVSPVKWPPSGVTRAGVAWSLPADICGVDGIAPLPSGQRLELLPTPTARVAAGRGTPSPETAAARMESGRRNLEDAVALMPTPTARDATRGAGRPFVEGRPLSEVVALLPDREDGAGASAVVPPGRFGRYELGVRRHEATFGVPVPEPTEPGRRGRPRLAPGFPEWMMLLPPGWMTDLVLPDSDPRPNKISRSDAIRIAGNGVVGAAVAHALPTLPTFPVALSLLTPALLEVAA